MKNLYLILFFCSVALSAQSLEKKVADDLCICIENEKITTTENLKQKIETCMISVVQKHFKEMYKTDMGEDKEFWNSVIILLTKNCPNFRKLALSSKKKPKIEEKSSILDCEDLKIGNYFYETSRGKNYLAFTKNQVIENRGRGAYTISKIDWLDKCVYRLTLQETNSRFDNVHMTENPYTFKIIENHKDYFVVQTEYIKGAGLNNVKIYKLPYTINNSESGNPTIEN